MFENKNQRTELSALGEFGLIDLIARSVNIKHPQTIRGIGDDAAVVDCQGLQALLTTDLMIEGVHFDLTFHPLKHLGYKCIAVNLSDVYAMNGEPRQVLVSIGASNRFSVEAIEELYEGINLACEKYNVDLIGGDTSATPSGLVVSVTALGVVRPGKITFRNTAQVNDLICVSGDLGAAYLGLQLLNREKKIFLENPAIQPDLSGYDYLLERQLKPEPRRDVVRRLEEAGVLPTSMMDVSDGLASELFHICTQSGKGCMVYEDKIPIDFKTAELAAEFNLNPVVCALNGGEDYELLFTAGIHDHEKIKAIKEVTVIGHITGPESGLHLVSRDGSQAELRAQGWNHFGSSR